MTFISRIEAVQKLGYLQNFERYWRLRNYELEHDLKLRFGGEWCISEWCPFNGRFCQLQEHVEPPHPPLRGVPPQPPETDIPWRVYGGALVDEHVQSDLPESEV